MVEYELPKLGVAGSIPVARSTLWRIQADGSGTLALFGKKDRDSEPIAPPPPPPVAAPIDPTRVVRRDSQPTTTVGPTLRVKGEFTGDEDVSVEGRVEGLISLTRHLVVGKTGVVEADVRALSVVVHGRVHGNVIAEQMVEIQPSGRLEGNIKCPKISIREGAHFKGNVDMSGGTTVTGPEAVGSGQAGVGPATPSSGHPPTAGTGRAASAKIEPRRS